MGKICFIKRGGKEEKMQDYLFQRINQLEQQAFSLQIKHWVTNEVFTFQWWILLTFLILPWVIWFIITDKTNRLESIAFGALIIIATTLLDVIGIQLNFWTYPFRLLPITPRAISFDMAMIPVGFMIIYYYFKSWGSFFLALLIMSSAYAFIGEPISVWLKLVEYIKWHYSYSFCTYILFGLLIRWIIVKNKPIRL
jgi:hypothetical protein